MHYTEYFGDEDRSVPRRWTDLPEMMMIMMMMMMIMMMMMMMMMIIVALQMASWLASADCISL